MAKSIEEGVVQVAVPSHTQYLNMITNLTRNTSRLAGFPDKTCDQVALAVDEAVTNVIRHSYHGDNRQTLRLEYRITADYLRIDIRHGGNQVDLRKVETPDMKRYIAERRKGGLGLVLMKKLMDRVEFDQDQGADHVCCMWKFRIGAKRPSLDERKQPC